MIKHEKSHMDHGFTQEQWDYIFKKFEGRDAFFIETFELPQGLGTVTNELYGPSCGDPPIPEVEAFYEKRGERAWNSRMVNMPKRPTRFVRVIAGPHADPCGACEGKKTLPIENMRHEWEEAPCPECAGTGEGTQYPCVLYTAYGVHAVDAPQSPREPGDLRMELNTTDGLSKDPEEIDKRMRLHGELEKAEAFWDQHALASL